MKLIIQIPCFNEEKTLALTVKDLPKRIKGISKIEYLVIDDGSSDKTVEIGKKNGVHHIVSHKKNQGLAKAFETGLEKCVLLGADIIVNTDADNQYNGKDIEKLVNPIINNQADIVIGSRPIKEHKEFSPIKKFLQYIGSMVVRFFSFTDVKDAPSGFRAYSRTAAKKIYVFSNYTYTLETIIQAGHSGLNIISVPIRVNAKTRPSRLFKRNFQYIRRSVFTIIRSFAIYRPFRFFGLIGLFFILIGFMPLLRFIYIYFYGDASGHIQSLILGSLFLSIGVITIIFSFLCDLISVNRKLLQKINDRLSDKN
jgi:glycosyltransferase involved in cell wall biosynthesis